MTSTLAAGMEAADLSLDDEMTRWRLRALIATASPPPDAVRGEGCSDRSQLLVAQRAGHATERDTAPSLGPT